MASGVNGSLQMNTSSKFNTNADVPPAMTVPPEIIVHILSYCDHRSLVNAMNIGENWKDCGYYLIGKKDYWKKLCMREIPGRYLWGYLMNEYVKQDMYKWIYLKWIGWKDLGMCSVCREVYDVLEPKFCPMHETTLTVENRYIPIYALPQHTTIKTPVAKIDFSRYDGTVTVELRTSRRYQTLYIKDVTTNRLVSVWNVNEALSSRIVHFYHHYGQFLVGLENGCVLIYNLSTWNMLNLTLHDLKIVGIKGRIKGFFITERGAKRIIEIRTSTRSYELSWTFGNELPAQSV